MAGADPEMANGSHCDEVLRDVWMFLDDEMDPENRAAVQRHLDDCSPCLAEAGIDEKLKHLLHSKCGGDRAPERLRVRLVARLATMSAALRDDDGCSVQVTTSTLTVTAERPQDPPDGSPR
ncbi:MAG TPA: mycothiol system anti-sigma-R factor [Nakamurella sp.]|jgi:mycothiol system anti-sigma-R factor|nr:mycothiol system anti-sigma-R factor [Nakamurella sp.]